jgi:MFS family permease
VREPQSASQCNWAIDEDAVSVRSSRLGIFKDRNFALYSLGNTVSWMGMWAQRIGVGWLSWDLSHSASWVGLVSLGQFLPLIFFAPLFGGLLDRRDAKRYAIVTNSVLTALAAVLYVVTAMHALTIERLCGLSVLLGVANSAYQPVRLALVNEVAPSGRLAEAIATSSMLFNLTRTLGPALAGLAIASFGIAATFAINAFSYAAIIGALAAMKLRAVPRKPSKGFVQEFVAGVRYVAGHDFIRELMLLSLVTSVLGRGVVELLPAFAGGLYQRGSSGLAALTTASGVGAILGGALLSQAGRAGWLTVLARRGSVWLGVVVVLLGAVPSYWLSIAAVAVLGLGLVVSSVGLQVLLQKSIDESYRGRVLGLWGMCNIAGPGIGGALLGAFAQVFGLRAATMASGLACVALAAWAAQRSGGLAEGVMPASLD